MHPNPQQLPTRARSIGKEAVYLVQVPPDWNPQRPWAVPPAFTGGELYAKNLAIRDALGFARSFNKRAVQAVQAGTFQGRWAILAKYLRPLRIFAGGTSS